MLKQFPNLRDEVEDHLKMLKDLLFEISPIMRNAPNIEETRKGMKIILWNVYLSLNQELVKNRQQAALKKEQNESGKFPPTVYQLTTIDPLTITPASTASLIPNYLKDIWEKLQDWKNKRQFKDSPFGTFGNEIVD